MLKGINPLLNGELLKALDEMGHADQLLLVDRNFPAFSAGRPVIRVSESSINKCMSAVLSVFPLDRFVERPLECMEVHDDPTRTTPTQQLVLRTARDADGRELQFGVVPRVEFYRRATAARVIVQTLEAAPYSCFVLQKGVIYADGVAEDGR